MVWKTDEGPAQHTADALQLLKQTRLGSVDAE